MRRSEILNLRWEWIDFDKRELTLPGSVTKNKKSLTISLNQTALDALAQALHTHRDSKWVFPQSPYSGFSARTVTDVIAKTCDQIGMPDATMHATRRTFNTRLIEQNINPLHVKELMGHSSLDMTDYTNLSRASLLEAVKMLEKTKDDTVPVPEQ